MEIRSYFDDIRKVIISELKLAEKEIIIAMAWFTNNEIFNALLEKLPNVKIKLVIINDDINNRKGGLNFQEFIDKGGDFYFCNANRPMHNKYCIIDNRTLICGSYNYTYLAESINYENIVVFKGTSEIIDNYVNDFKRITKNNNSIKSIEKYLEDNPYNKDVFSFNNYGIKDIYNYAIELKNNGMNELSEEIIESCENFMSLDKKTIDSFIINDVIYRQWKEDYYLDNIQYFEGELILKFRTFLNESGWIHSPKANHSWLIRNTKDKELYEKCYKISNIRINGKLMVEVSTEEEIFYFTQKKSFEFDKDTDLGYEKDEESRPKKSNGEFVPIKFFRIGKNAELTCFIHFNGKKFHNLTIDLIEGKSQEEKNNHWHCFDINMKLNRKIL